MATTPMTAADSLAPLREFVQAMTRLVDRAQDDERRLLDEGRVLLQRLVAADDWLPAMFARASPLRYQQYLLHCDPNERFSVVSFVWGPGQRTPVHDHGVWGLVGMLRGAETSTAYWPSETGLVAGVTEVLHAGEVAMVTPLAGDVHQVANAVADRSSISIHVYGANIGRLPRHVYHPESGICETFVSGYAAEVLPNLWQGPAPS